MFNNLFKPKFKLFHHDKWTHRNDHLSISVNLIIFLFENILPTLMQFKVATLMHDA